MNGKDRLPYELGHGDRRWFTVAGAMAALIAWGIFAYGFQLTHGDIVTGMRTIGRGGAAWGVYIAMYVYFVGVSFAGITVTALVRLFRLEVLRPLTRMAELLTVVSLVLGSMAVLADLGRPGVGLLNLPAFARTMSPFFGTFTLVVAGYLYASLVYFYLAGRADAAYCATLGGRLRPLYLIWATGFRGTPAEYQRHHNVSFWLALAILPMLVAAHSTLGFVFGIQGGRPGWFSALQAPGFVIMAGVSGIGVLIIVAAAVRHFFHLEDTIRPEAFSLLGNFLWILAVIYLYFILVEELTSNYAAVEMETHVAHSISFGPYAPVFWTTIACLIVPVALLFRQYLQGRAHIPQAVAAGVLVNIAAILKRFLIVVPSQTHGLLLPYPEGFYIPSWVEISVTIGLFAMGILACLVFARFFPIVPLEVPEEIEKAPPEVESVWRARWRLTFLWTSLLGGIAIAVVGFAASARVGTEVYSDPVIPFAPVVFIIGVMLAFYAPAFYETLPPTPPGGSGPGS